jgi:hypothetical protein
VSFARFQGGPRPNKNRSRLRRSKINFVHILANVFRYYSWKWSYLGLRTRLRPPRAGGRELKERRERRTGGRPPGFSSSRGTGAATLLLPPDNTHIIRVIFVRN